MSLSVKKIFDTTIYKTASNLSPKAKEKGVEFIETHPSKILSKLESSYNRGEANCVVKKVFAPQIKYQPSVGLITKTYSEPEFLELVTGQKSGRCAANSALVFGLF